MPVQNQRDSSIDERMARILFGLGFQSTVSNSMRVNDGLRRRLFGACVAVLAGLGRADGQTLSGTDDGTTLKQMIIFGRHSIRATTYSTNALDQYAADPYPGFATKAGDLTPNGERAARLLGDYFREYLVHEGLLTGDAATDLARGYFRANSIQRSYMTCSEFGAGLIPDANVPVHTYPVKWPDPIIDPLLAAVVTVDPAQALAEVTSLYGDGTGLAATYASDLAVISSVLYPPGTHPLYPPGTTPPTNAPPGAVDPTTIPIAFAASSPIEFPPPLGHYLTGGVVGMGGMAGVVAATDPFIMQYADGFPEDQVGWGRFTMETLSQQTRITTLQIEIGMRTPYLARVQSSNLGQHILRSLQQAVDGQPRSGALGDAQTKVLVIVSSDYYVAGLAGLLGLHWHLPGYEPDYCAPGGALVFELRERKATGEHLVRVFYTAQTLNQLRELAPLTLDAPPATVQLAVPGGSRSGTDPDVDFDRFAARLVDAIDPACVQPVDQEHPPSVMNPYTARDATNLTVRASGRTLAVTWPPDHRGWILQVQTNELGAGRWLDVPGSAHTTSVIRPLDASEPAAFYRLRQP